jgi:hypothetical protein
LASDLDELLAGQESAALAVLRSMAAKPTVGEIGI